ncbi:LysR family transcriptional regulator [Salinisphaera hydrothermalis]|uniref:LysR family transcriptional regulator n=1 Tax=Salinisphaera hydrothermalis TaxID=563188 RepID=UPI0033412ED7
MKFTLRQLHVFVVMMETGQVRRTAQRVNLSEAAVSQALRELADGLQTPLFERRGRSLAPTVEARRLRGFIEGPLAQLEALPDRLRVHPGNLVGTVRVVASTTLARYLLPPALAKLRQKHPGLGLRMRSGNSLEAERRVAAGEADVGFIEGPPTRDDISAEHWQTDQVQIIAPAAFDLKDVGLAELYRLPWVGRERGSGTRAVFEHGLAMAGHAPPQAEFILDDPESLLRAVAAGAGLAYVTAMATGPTIARGDIKIVPLGTLELTRPLWRIHSGERSRSHFASVFEQALDAEIEASTA